MSSDVAIRVEGLSKKYRIGHRGTHADDLRHRLANALSAPFKKLFGRNGQTSSSPLATSHSPLATPSSLTPNTSHLTPDPSDHIWALRDVSFEVKQGEILGVIGRNGAGKSTLLKILSRITEPTAGRVECHGRLAALLEVGTGFHSELTGRENVYLNGSILGMTKSEIDKQFDAIVDFAGVEKFIDTPVKRYSSGMHVRLGFGVAAHLRPEILIVDEVLAVGDAEFQKRCLGKMHEVSESGRTVLFVSHNMAAMNSLCNQTAWLEQGELHVLGETSAVVGDYLRTTVPSVRGCEIHFDADTSKPAQLRRARIMNQRRDITDRFSCDETVVVELLMQVHRPIPGLYGYFEIVRNDGVKIMMSDSYDACPNPLDNLEVGLHKTCITIPQRTLGPGEYSVYLNFTSLFADGYQVDGPGTIGTFVLDDHTSRRGNARPGFFSTLLEWQTTPVPEHVLS